MIHVNRYRVQAIEPALRLRLLERDGCAYVDVAAYDMQSAWRKFVTQRFGVLKPGPSHYDISLVRP